MTVAGEDSRTLLALGAQLLADAGVPSPGVDAGLLLEFVTGRAGYLLRLGAPVAAPDAEKFRELVSQRARRIPLQHLTGQAHFRYLTLAVGPGVFVPRPETELLVDQVLAWLPTQPRPAGSWRMLDLCTGSAALALALASEVPGTEVIAVEVSRQAVAWAQQNLDRNRAQVAAVGGSVQLVTGDVRLLRDAAIVPEAWWGTVDVVVANPPYIPAAAVPRDPEVRDHDPELALYGGPDGLAVVRPLARHAAELLRPGGLLVIEHADSQGAAAGERGVPGVLADERSTDGTASWLEVRDHLDLGGRPRYASAVRAGA